MSYIKLQKMQTDREWQKDQWWTGGGGGEIIKEIPFESDEYVCYLDYNDYFIGF